jgi:hypothetical protein
MSSDWPTPRTDIAILAILGEQLHQASRRPDFRRRWWPLRWGRRSLAVALAVTLGAGGAAVAGTHILSVGDTIPAGGPGGPPENRSSVPQTIVAQGRTPVAGPFQITTYGSAGVSDGGDVLEPRGLPCVELNLTDPPETTPVLGSSFCGAEVRERFTVSHVLVLGDDGRKELILFGSMPESARGVRVVIDGGEQVPVQRFDGPPGYQADLWAAPVSSEDRTVRAEWVRADGSPGDRARDLSDALTNLRSLGVKP